MNGTTTIDVAGRLDMRKSLNTIRALLERQTKACEALHTVWDGVRGDLGRDDVVVLFVRADSIYKTLPGVECYDEARDARTWPGGCPVVAHPPCRTWGSLKHFATAAPAHEHALGPWAIDQVRRWGGVLEHPKGSTLFRECGCALPGGPPDEWGGMTLEVDQFHWGHKARKRTLLYVVGTRDIPAMPRRAGKPTHVVDRPGRARKAERPNSAGLLPWVSHKEREATPPAFAAWLVELARRCSKHNAAHDGRRKDTP